jgi:hypothetical protein
MSRIKQHSVLPGFGLGLGYTLLYLSLIVLIPLSALLFKTSTMSWADFYATVTSPRVMASYQLTFGASLIGALLNLVFGMLVAWVLVRYSFPGRHQGGFRTAGRAGGADLHRSAFRRAHGAAHPGRPRCRTGRSRHQSGCAPLADLPHVTLPILLAGAADRFRAGLRTRGRRIRLGHLHRRQHPDGVGDHAADHHHQAGAIRLRRCNRHRGGDAGAVSSSCCWPSTACRPGPTQ